MSLTFRDQKGSKLTSNEVDENFRTLNEKGVDYVVGEILRSPGLRIYNNQVYVLQDTVVFPFTCADFATELAADKWVAVGGDSVRLEDIFTYFKGDFYICQATGTTLNTVGYAAIPTLVGTGTNNAANLSSGFLYATWAHRRQIGSTNAGSNASLTFAYKIVSVGLGFYASSKVAVTQTANGRMFFGFTDSTSDIGNINPSTLTNLLGFGTDSGDANLQIIHNDNSGTASKIDLGSSFAITTGASDTNTYLIETWNFQGLSTCYFRIKNLINGVTSSIVEVTTNLPTSTDGLAYHLWANNGIDTTSVTVYFSNHSLKRQS